MGRLVKFVMQPGDATECVDLHYNAIALPVDPGMTIMRGRDGKMQQRLTV